MSLFKCTKCNTKFSPLKSDLDSKGNPFPICWYCRNDIHLSKKAASSDSKKGSRTNDV